MQGFPLSRKRGKKETHTFISHTSAEMLVVMEMVSQHAITMYKNSNMDALCW